MKTKYFYTKAVDRLRKAGITDPTAQIAALEEEIDGYRNQIDLKAVKIENDEVPEDKTVPKHPSYNCKRGMLCPSCDKALWVKVEIKGLFGKKEITVKEQPNFCKYCGQAFKDNSYDFRKSCFSQIEAPVNGVSRKRVAELILQDYEKLGGGE